MAAPSNAPIVNWDHLGQPTVEISGAHLCKNINCVDGCAAGYRPMSDCY
jgi:hypothetical protein